MKCIAETLLDEVLLQNLYGPLGCHVTYSHYRVIIRVTIAILGMLKDGN